MKYLLVSLPFLLVNCMNKVEVPKTVKTDVSGTINIIYTIGLDLKLQDLFSKDCQTTLGPNATQDEINACISSHTTAVLDAITAALAKNPLPTSVPVSQP